ELLPARRQIGGDRNDLALLDADIDGRRFRGGSQAGVTDDQVHGFDLAEGSDAQRVRLSRRAGNPPGHPALGLPNCATALRWTHDNWTGIHMITPVMMT